MLEYLYDKNIKVDCFLYIYWFQMTDSNTSKTSSPESSKKTRAEQNNVSLWTSLWVVLFCGILMPLWILHSRPAKLSSPEVETGENKISSATWIQSAIAVTSNAEREILKPLLLDWQIDGSSSYTFISKTEQIYQVKNLPSEQLGEALEKCSTKCEHILISDL